MNRQLKFLNPKNFYNFLRFLDCDQSKTFLIFKRFILISSLLMRNRKNVFFIEFIFFWFAA